MTPQQLEILLNEKLAIHQIQDYAPNGLQIEGRNTIKKIITGVTASQALIDYAIEQKADAILVHHGYFWKGEDQCLIGIKGKRIKALMQNNINLFAYHLPLDIHPELGNNVLLAKALDMDNLQPMENGKTSIPVWGTLKTPITAEALNKKVETLLNRKPLTCHDNASKLIQKIGLCTGGGQDYLELAANLELDAFITGEVSERTIHIAREYGIHFISAGHHATETFGINALGEWLKENYSFKVEFKNIFNPV